MKAKLKFDLNDEFEREDFENALNGHKFKAILRDVLEDLRRKRKYEDKESISIEDMEKMIYDALSAENLEIF